MVADVYPGILPDKIDLLAFLICERQTGSQFKSEVFELSFAIVDDNDIANQWNCVSMRRQSNFLGEIPCTVIR